MFSKIVSFFMVIWMFICSLLGIGAGKGDNNEMISYSADGKTVIVTLSENPSTGYGWEYIISDENTVKLANSTYIPADSGFGHEALAGAPGTRIFEFSALKAGTATLTLTYERSWENDPVRTIVIELTAANDLTVTAKLISDVSQ
ncbi:MAG: protease inhibitor I42 family protein [Clostridia bacterium]|nr:protease inhibitor I42 family protein [Clostridia bacterium]